MHKSYFLTLCLSFFAIQAFATTGESCDQILSEMVARSGYLIKAADIKKVRSQLKVDLDDIYFAISVHAAQKGLQPISNFQVGAAGVTNSGDVILGSNIELKGTQLGQALHAERTVIALANESGQPIRTLYSSVTPCGGCRQWLNEINGGTKMQIVSKGKDGLYKRILASLLPEGFGPADLGQTGILDGKKKQWKLADNTLMPELAEALERSYAPYSNEPSAAAIILKNGEVYTGAYIENAAYDSYPALNIAIAKMVMSDHKDFSEISEVIVASASVDPTKKKNIDHRSGNSQIAFSEALQLIPSQITFISDLVVTPR